MQSLVSHNLAKKKKKSHNYTPFKPGQKAGDTFDDLRDGHKAQFLMKCHEEPYLYNADQLAEKMQEVFQSLAHPLGLLLN